MKVNKVIDRFAVAAEKRQHEQVKREQVKQIVEAAAVEEPAQHHGLIFQPSEQLKNMLTLIARDNPKLYNRIVGMD